MTGTEPVRETPRRAPATPRPRSANLDRLFLSSPGSLTWDQMTGFRGGPRRQGHRLLFWSWLALGIDGLILVSLSSFFLIAFSLLVRAAPFEVLRVAAGLGTASLFTLSFALSAWLYLVTTRVFFGFSIGEWSCDLRLGRPTQRWTAGYSLKVILRASLVLATGLITLPLLSLLTGHDVAGKLTGLELTSLK